MINLFQLYEILHIAANKDVKSNWLTPEQFELELTAKSVRLMRDRLGLPERYQPGTFNAGADASRVIETDLSPFFIEKEESVELQKTNITDWYYIDTFYTPDSVFPEIISKQEVPTRIKSPTKTPTKEYPAAIVITEGLKIWPATVTKATVMYYKKPKEPVFKTKVDNEGYLVYDAAGSTELEWRDENKLDILHLIMQDLGVNIEKQDLQQLATKLVEGGK
jgi:hypothetical protein